MIPLFDENRNYWSSYKHPGDCDWPLAARTKAVGEILQQRSPEKAEGNRGNPTAR
jgi:hypothetical protein